VIDHAPNGHDDVANVVLGLVATIGIRAVNALTGLVWGHALEPTPPPCRPPWADDDIALSRARLARYLTLMGEPRWP
jgi:hypothetical protein